MINIWFKDQKEPILTDDPQDIEVYKDFWKKEKDRCINGFFLAEGKVFVPGRLYFHTVYWKIAMYVTLPNGKKVRQIATPLLRDIDWDIFNDFETCDREGKFYELVGSRDFGKSVIAGSAAGHQYTFYPNSECVISGGATNYIKLASDKIEDGLLNVHPIFRKQRLTSDWKKEIRAGWKDKSTKLPNAKSSNSRILIRNYENGTNTMAANGTRPSFHLIDEIGTIQNLIGCVKDSDGCWWSGGGNKPSCLVMLCGTGGDMEVGAEAAEIFYNPDAYNMLSFTNEWEGGGKIGRFISALRAKLAYKEPKTLSQYLGLSHPDLDNISILVSNEEKALKEWWEVEHKKAVKSGNSKTLLKFKAYWPIKPSDSFIVLTKNDFNTEAAQAQKARLLAIESQGIPVEIYNNGEGLVHKIVNKPFITEFPVKTQEKDAPIQIWEFPVEDPPFGLYVAGIDPYRQSESEYSDSLGVVYIYKRMNSISSERYQNMFVACYAARPTSKDKWNETARNLIKYYNARALCENDEMSFIDYMLSKNDGHYLEDQPSWLKEYVPNTTVKRTKGIHRSAKAIRDFLDGTLKSYLDEIIEIIKDEKGSILQETTGVSRVLDPMLLEEITKFSKDPNNKVNTDRVIAAELAVALAYKLDPIIGKSGSNEDPRLKALFNPNKPIQGNKMFLPQKQMFSKRKNKLF
jgi:hypothetical protein